MKENNFPSEEEAKDTEKFLDSQLWHACAGGMVQMPSVNSKVYYFPQGHAEHAQTPVDFGTSVRIPPLILCRVLSVKFMADSVTDEVFAKIQLIPLKSNEPDYNEEDELVLGNNGSDLQEKLASFAKTLTQSDANNGGGFSVPRYCAETIFPRLDYSADPPVQTVLAKDVHGKVWKFRHIYRGTPRRHLLTTGWSNFVNEKKLVAGDSIVFLRTENGDLCVGIRRAKRGIGGGPEMSTGWNPPAGNCMYGGFSVFLREDESKFNRSNGNGGRISSGSSMRGRGKVKADSVMEASASAARGQPFKVIYYPRASTPEFCVKASAVRAAMRIQWCSGMRFKMAFETEDSSRISWFMGTISAVHVADLLRWPGSPWRLLQVSWDEPDLLQNVKRVSPWLVELVSNMPAIHLAPPFSPPRKKPRLPHPEFSLDVPLSTSPFTENTLIPSSSPLCCLPDNAAAVVGIQGPRHSQYGANLPELRFGKLHSGLFHTGFHRLDHFAPSHRISTGLLVPNSSVREDVSCLLTIGNASQNAIKPKFMLFGKPIITEEQLSLSPNNSNSDKTTNLSYGSGSSILQNGTGDNNSSSEGPVWYRDRKPSELGPCKLFIESEDVGQTLDLSSFGSYEELYRRLANMFGLEKAELNSRLLYRDIAGVVKHTGDEPFAEFMKAARRLTIFMDSGSDNIGKL
ncbi:auxin response factor 18-like [Phalaenopsis equestris]|uniref:auxin response factor 18-like n=1 Tax=Phalaenopsis equestris TaxID=78828 RepID=UPI0009E4E426|nr:auxin response factor 18-like [Phalaenopsis equestris]XP_020592363.1 auxin response factor 18-like [Phalaenopsis equestris]